MPISRHTVRCTSPIGNESVPKIIINDTVNFFSETAISILVISDHNSLRVRFDKIALVYFIRRKYKYFSVGNGQPREPALCQNCRRNFVDHIHGLAACKLVTAAESCLETEISAALSWADLARHVSCMRICDCRIFCLLPHFRIFQQNAHIAYFSS